MILGVGGPPLEERGATTALERLQWGRYTQPSGLSTSISTTTFPSNSIESTQR